MASFFQTQIVRIFGSGSPQPPHNAVTKTQQGLSLDDARSKQQAALRTMRRGVADVSVSRQRLDVHIADLERAMEKLLGVADSCREASDELGAANADARHLIMTGQCKDLRSQRDALAEQETMLKNMLSQLQARVAGFEVTAVSLGTAVATAQAHAEIAVALEKFNSASGTQLPQSGNSSAGPQLPGRN